MKQKYQHPQTICIQVNACELLASTFTDAVVEGTNQEVGPIPGMKVDNTGNDTGEGINARGGGIFDNEW